MAASNYEMDNELFGDQLPSDIGDHLDSDPAGPVPQPVEDTALAAGWLEYVHEKPTGMDAVVVICSATDTASTKGKTTWRSSCHTFADLPGAAEAATAASAKRWPTYYRFHLIAEAVPSHRRGAGNLTTLVTHFAGDVDIAGPGHKVPDGKVAPTLEQALKLIYAALAPSAVLHSGGGLYPVWRMSEPFVVACPADLERMKRIGKRFDAALSGHGFHVDKTMCDMSRVIRLPGTVNRKPGRDARPVTVHVPPVSGAGDYSVEQLEELLPVLPVKPPRPERDPATKTAGSKTPSNRDAAWEIFNDRYTLAQVLAADPTCTWEEVGTRGGMEAWRYVGSSSDYSLKQSDTGVVIVWSSTVEARLHAAGARLDQPGGGLDLWGLACGLAGVDPTSSARGVKP